MSVRNHPQLEAKRGLNVGSSPLLEQPCESPRVDPNEDADELEARVTRETASPAASPDLVPILGANLRRLRQKRGLSLERFSQLSNVSRAMLSQVELGHSAPTINVIWRIANALGVPLGTLLAAEIASGPQVLRAAQAKVLASHDGRFSSRALFPLDGPRRSEFYELRLRAHALERAPAHAAGTTENLTVNRGRAIISVGSASFELGPGDAIMFVADVVHAYENPSAEDALLYLVMSYASEIGS